MNGQKQEIAALRLELKNLAHEFADFKSQTQLALHKIHNDQELLDLRIEVAILRHEKGAVFESRK